MFDKLMSRARGRREAQEIKAEQSTRRARQEELVKELNVFNVPIDRFYMYAGGDMQRPVNALGKQALEHIESMAVLDDLKAKIAASCRVGEDSRLGDESEALSREELRRYLSETAIRFGYLFGDLAHILFDGQPDVDGRIAMGGDDSIDALAASIAKAARGQEL